MRCMRTYIGIMILCIALFSCQPRPGLWIVAGSTVDNLVFGVSEERTMDKPIVIEEIYVYDNGPNPDAWKEGGEWYLNPVWTVFRKNKEPITSLSRIRYGDTPKGLSVIVRAKSLDANYKYKAWMHFKDSNNKSRAVSVKFRFSRQGRAEEFVLE